MMKNETTLVPFGWTRERYCSVLENLMSDVLSDAFCGGDPETFVFSLDWSEEYNSDCACWWSFEVIDAETVELILNEQSPGGGFTFTAGELKADGSFIFDEESWTEEI